MADERSLRRTNIAYTEIVATPAKPAGWTLRDLRNLVDVTLDLPAEIRVSITSTEIVVQSPRLNPTDAQMPQPVMERVNPVVERAKSVVERG
jgi:hypothetical protein